MLPNPPLRDKIPVVEDSSGKQWVELSPAWLKWFSMIQQSMETILINYKDYETGATANAQGIDGALSTIDYLSSLGQGLIAGHTIWHSIGYNPSIGATQEDVNEMGITYTVPSDSGIQMTVRSANVNDTAAGTGVRTVHINYLDASGLEQTETVTTNGGAVNTVATNIRRVNYFHTTSAGSGAVAAGNITLTNTGNTVTYAQISTGTNFSRHGFFTIPAGKTGFISSAYIGAGSSVSGRFVRALLRTTSDHHGNRTANIFQFKRMVLVQDGGIQMKFDIPIKVPALADIKFSAINDTSAEVACYIEGWFE
ncbi:hypothetical protein [Caudoviricetes sp.]|nr:hypothetical protein [Caudoviricetes sp.]